MKRPENYSHPLIDYLKIHKAKTIAGNKEYYAILEFKDEKFIYHGGDTFPVEEKFRNEIGEDEVISLLKSYYKDKCEIFDIKIPDSDEEWEIFLNKNYYI